MDVAVVLQSIPCVGIINLHLMLQTELRIRSQSNSQSNYTLKGLNGFDPCGSNEYVCVGVCLG